MTTEIIISPILDKHMNTNINESPVWKKAFKPEEITERIRGMHPNWYEYHVRFENTIPIQCTKMKEI